MKYDIAQDTLGRLEQASLACEGTPPPGLMRDIESGREIAHVRRTGLRLGEIEAKMSLLAVYLRLNPFPRLQGYNDRLARDRRETTFLIARFLSNKVRGIKFKSTTIARQAYLDALSANSTFGQTIRRFTLALEGLGIATKHGLMHDPGFIRPLLRKPSFLALGNSNKLVREVRDLCGESLALQHRQVEPRRIVYDALELRYRETRESLINVYRSVMHFTVRPQGQLAMFSSGRIVAKNIRSLINLGKALRDNVSSMVEVGDDVLAAASHRIERIPNESLPERVEEARETLEKLRLHQEQSKMEEYQLKISLIAEKRAMERRLRGKRPSSRPHDRRGNRPRRKTLPTDSAAENTRYVAELERQL